MRRPPLDPAIALSWGSIALAATALTVVLAAPVEAPPTAVAATVVGGASASGAASKPRSVATTPKAEAETEDEPPLGTGDCVVVGLAGQELDARTAEALRTGSVAGLLLMGRNVGSEAQLVRLTRAARDAAHAGGLPDPILCIDQEGGKVDRLKGVRPAGPEPSARSLAQEGAAAIRERAARVGADLSRYGINVDLAPCLDLDDSTSSKAIIGSRSYGADPELALDCGVAAIEGLRAGGVAAVVKHYPGHGLTPEDTHGVLPTVRASRAALRRHEDVFRRAVERARPDGVIVAHLIVPEIDPNLPTSLSPACLSRLRAFLGPQAVAITDGGGMDALAHYGDESRRAALALRAGNDVYLTATDLSGLPRSFRERVRAEVPRSRGLLASAARVRAWRRRLQAVKAPPTP